VANVRVGNKFYIDTQYSGSSDELAYKNLLVLAVIVTATGANGRIVLSDGAQVALDLRVATSGTTQVFDFSKSPVLFQTSIRPSTLSNAVATVIGRESRA
jgi:hypothetical protein